MDDVRFCKGCDGWADFNGRRKDADYHSDECRFQARHRKDKDWVRLKEEQEATLTEAMRLTGLTRSQIGRRAATGDLRIRKVDGRLYVKRADLNRFLGTTPLTVKAPVSVVEPGHPFHGNSVVDIGRIAKKDYPAFKIDISGDRYGAAWSGRIVIYAAEKFVYGDLVDVRAMVARHKTKVVTTSHAAMEGGAYTRTKEVGLQAEGEETILERPYIALEKSSAPTSEGQRLVWVECHTKTTIKGYGRQYWASITGSPLFEWRVGGGARSGRFHSTGVLGVVDEDHYLISKGTGDVSFESIIK